jgi:predicted NAD-dependent protein-ADP-ribosyltransferase YbiA (DUF1768 family)
VEIIAFTKVNLPHGWLGNMAPLAVVHEDIRYRTEALFQVLRFSDLAIRHDIRKQASPMAAKMIAKRNRSQMVVIPQSQRDLDNMAMVLRLKIEQHPQLVVSLLATKQSLIVEDCTKRPRGSGLFWGAALIDGQWRGDNNLGELWMRIRATKLS